MPDRVTRMQGFSVWLIESCTPGGVDYATAWLHMPDAITSNHEREVFVYNSGVLASSRGRRITYMARNYCQRHLENCNCPPEPAPVRVSRETSNEEAALAALRERLVEDAGATITYERANPNAGINYSDLEEQVTQYQWDTYRASLTRDQQRLIDTIQPAWQGEPARLLQEEPLQWERDLMGPDPNLEWECHEWDCDCRNQNCGCHNEHPPTR